MTDERALILVVDDDLLLAAVVETLLVSAGYRVIRAAAARQALDHIFKDDPDLVLLDIDLPTRSGIDVLKRIRASPDRKLLPVVMMSARQTMDDVHGALFHGAQDYLSKPFDEDALLGKVRRHLRKDRAAPVDARLRPL